MPPGARTPRRSQRPDHEVDRDLSERIGKRGPYGTELAGPARAEGESPQIGRQLARGSRPDETEEQGAERRNVEGVVPALDRGDGSLGQLAQPAVPGDDEVPHLTSLRFRPGSRGRGAGPAIGLVDVGADLAEGFALPAQAHHVTRDVEADGSGCRVTGVGHGTVTVHALDVAVAIVAMADVLAPAEAGNVAQGLAVLEGVPVRLLHVSPAQSREVRELAAGHGLDLISVLVASHRPCGRSAARQPPGTGHNQSSGKQFSPGRALVASNLVGHRLSFHVRSLRSRSNSSRLISP